MNMYVTRIRFISSFEEGGAPPRRKDLKVVLPDYVSSPWIYHIVFARISDYYGKEMK